MKMKSFFCFPKKCFDVLSRSLGKILALPVIFYRKFISPLFPACCKYYPSCSAYALQSFRRHGAFLGGLLTVWRLLRCNPFSRGGVDHVPEKVTIDYFKIKKDSGAKGVVNGQS